MHIPDLIQRIYHQKEKGDDTNFKKVFGELRSSNFDFISDFEFQDRRIFWTCFESKKYYDIIKEEDNRIYFYLWDKRIDFEIVIPSYIVSDFKKENILEQTASFHSIWIIGPYFPGLENFKVRPVKIIFQHIKRMDYGPISKLTPLFKKMLVQYQKVKRPIFEQVDYPKTEKGEKRWRKIVDRKGHDEQ